MAPCRTRQNTVPATWGRHGGHTAKTRSQGQRRWQEAAPDEGHRPRGRRRRALAAALRELRQHPPNRPGSGSHHTASCCGRRCAAVLAAITSATVRGPVASARDEPRRPAARSARPQRRQPPSRTPCMTCRRSRPEPRKTRNGGLESGICAPFRIPALPGAPIARDPASRGRAGRGTLRTVIPLRQRNAVPRGRPLKAASADTPHPPARLAPTRPPAPGARSARRTAARRSPRSARDARPIPARRGGNS